MDKLRQPGTQGSVSPRSVRASRMILDTIVELDQMTKDDKNYTSLSTYCIAFYPFRAFFVLYYHILLSKDPSLYTEDVRRLKRIETFMKRAAESRFEYIPISRAISSLNQVTKHMRQPQASVPAQRAPDVWPPWGPGFLGGQVMAQMFPSAAPQEQSNGPIDLFGSYQTPDSMQWLPDFGDMQFNTSADLQKAAAQPDFEPVEYMQTVESQFTGGSWHYNWWDNEGSGNFGGGGSAS
jgi:hypothetical protein